MKDHLSDWIARELLDLPDGESVAPDTDLLGSGLLDSLGVMSLVFHIEQHTGVEVPPEDVTLENFVSIDAIDAYLKGRRAG
ncbi:MAG: phosphopantetheine-binding protein [Gemmatimonadota bacterium]